MTKKFHTLLLALVISLVAITSAQSEIGINGETPAHEAAAKGDLQLLRSLVERDANINAVDNQGRTPLYEAVVANSAECVRLLLAEGADTEIETVGGWTPLRAGLTWGKNNAVLTLLAAGAPLPKIAEDGETALMLASWRGSITVFEALVERDEDPLAVDREKRTALHYAVLGRNPEIVSRLLALGSHPQKADETGMTALALGLKTERPELWRPLLQAADELDSALSEACSYGVEEAVQSLLIRGALPNFDVNASLAASCPNTKKATAIVNLLLPETDPLGVGAIQALSNACRVGNSSLVSLLLERGAPVGAEDNRGDYAILLATEKGQVSIVRQLLKQGANPQVTGPSNLGALERLDRRITLLESQLERYGRSRCLHPRERRARQELADLLKAQPELSALLGNFSQKIGGPGL